ncbi:RagB/SusD family nutrient uptake outer membrane protein [Mucilaginibacter robiniae]|uniref:RagB/SusD family nutrient uptake outer membrane protein n=1 Tax=Mucilaginibacter robiniae TaxID=2728022 RepID=A0A7L5E1R7_9SPHI|nr:RagB/SusD family nutrient uptake outer membrane protein [Mucilaginibacter robiniae]QJD95514.1 RagB/SusD family nutrient uptake outer membrane protein [Mucilaginibacter robiniae]
MKAKYIKFSVIVAAGVSVLFSCKKSFLELSPAGSTLETNYYSTPTEALAGVVAAYDPLNTETGGSDNTYADPLGALNSASDDCFAGGGSSSDMTTWQAVNNYSLLTPATGPQGEFWNINFTGVNRTNLILSKLASVPGLSASDLKRYTAEAKFLRAHYYFDLVRLFGNVPLMTAPLATADLYNQKQVASTAVYAQVETDLTAAIPDLPTTVPTSENGRASQGAAKALLGKVYLYEKKWAQAAAQFADVNGTPGGTSTYGYHLLTNYGDVFSPSNKFNAESIFEIQHTGSQSYNWNNWNTFKSNVYTQMVGARSYSGPIYFAGWGFNPITTQLVTAMKGDPRYGYTIVNLDSLTKATNTKYDPSYQNTGYFLVKYAPLLKYKTASGTTELNWPNDYIEMRLADTYLMEAEALVQAGTNTGRAQSLLDAVRARVKLASVPATLTNIYNERRLELATEGHRWFDLVRTGQAPTVLAFKNFKSGVNEILPIPLRELNNTVLVQNKGY